MKTVNAKYAGYVSMSFKDGKWTVTVSSSTHVTKYLLDEVYVAGCSFVAAGDAIGGVKANQPVDTNIVYATKPGTTTVIKTGDTWKVIVTHADGSQTVYNDLNEVFVTNCSSVDVGDPIGSVDVVNVPDVSLTGIMSVYGGGDLKADRYFSLVNDEEEPAPNYHYATDELGVRGWYPNPEYLVNNGLSVDPSLSNRFQLGGDLIKHTHLTQNFNLSITDGTMSIGNAMNVSGARLHVEKDTTGVGIYSVKRGQIVTETGISVLGARHVTIGGTFAGTVLAVGAYGELGFMGSGDFSFTGPKYVSLAGINGVVTMYDGTGNLTSGVSMYSGGAYYLNVATSNSIDRFAAIRALYPIQTPGAEAFTGTVENYYGLYIDPLNYTFFDITNRYAIYQEGTTDLNLFFGDMRFAKYPSTRNDGSTLSALYVDSLGNLKHGPLDVDLGGATENGGYFIWNQSAVIQAATFRINSRGTIEGNITDGLKIINTGSDYASISFQGGTRTNAQRLQIGQYANGDGFFFHNGSYAFIWSNGGGEAIRLTADRKLLVGTTAVTGTYNLQVVGGIWSTARSFMYDPTASTSITGTVLGNLHLQQISTATNVASLTFGGHGAGFNLAQAGIYVQTMTDGTYMYLNTTDSFISGSKNRIRITPTGVVTVYNLAGTGDRFVQADSTGVLSATITIQNGGNYIWNQTAVQQPTSNFWISGSGTIGSSSILYPNDVKLQVTGGAWFDKAVTNATVPIYGAGHSRGMTNIYTMSGAITNTNYHFALSSTLSLSNTSTFNSYRASALYGSLVMVNSVISAGEVSAIQAHVNSTNASSSGDINGIHIRQQVGGTHTNFRAIYIATNEEAGTIANYYGIYQAQATAKNYFAGQLLKGVTSSTYDVDLYIPGGLSGGFRVKQSTTASNQQYFKIENASSAVHMYVNGSGIVSFQGATYVSVNDIYNTGKERGHIWVNSSNGGDLNGLVQFAGGIVSGGGVHKPIIGLINTRPAAVNEYAYFTIIANRTTGGKTRIADIGAYITDIDNVAYKGTLVFSTANGAAPIERMWIDHTGVITVSSLNDSTGIARMVVTTNGVLSYQDIPAGGGGGAGTVTSVAASVTAATALTVSGSPITTSGTLAFTWTGATTQYVLGDGTLATIPTPFGGAWTDVTAKPNGGEFIYNQNASAQVTANYWIDGDGIANKYTVSGAGTIASPAIGLLNSGVAGFYQPAANSIGFVTNSLERMRLDADGKLSINKTAPTHYERVSTDGMYYSTNNVIYAAGGSNFLGQSTYLMNNTTHGTILSGAFTGSAMFSTTYNIDGTFTMSAGKIFTSHYTFMSLSATANAAASTITMTQANGIRTVSAHLVQIHLPTLGVGYTTRVTHVAGMHLLAPFAQGNGPYMAMDNYYGLLINPSDEYNGTTITNRYGIYQDGINDMNVFRGQMYLQNVPLYTTGGNTQVLIRNATTGRLEYSNISFGRFGHTGEDVIATANRSFSVDTYKLFITSSGTSSDSVLQVTRSGTSGNAIEGTGTTNAPIIKANQGGGGTALWGSNSNNGIGVEGWSVGTTAVRGLRSNAGTSDFINVMEIMRGTTGTAANGIGGYLNFQIVCNTAVQYAPAGYIGMKWTDAAHASRTSAMEIWMANNAVMTKKFSIAGNGDTVVEEGDLEVKVNTKGLILQSPDGTRYRITAVNGGTLSITAV